MPTLALTCPPTGQAAEARGSAALASLRGSPAHLADAQLPLTVPRGLVAKRAPSPSPHSAVGAGYFDLGCAAVRRAAVARRRKRATRRRESRAWLTLPRNMARLAEEISSSSCEYNFEPCADVKGSSSSACGSWRVPAGVHTGEQRGEGNARERWALCSTYYRADPRPIYTERGWTHSGGALEGFPEIWARGHNLTQHERDKHLDRSSRPPHRLFPRFKSLPAEEHGQ